MATKDNTSHKLEGILRGTGIGKFREGEFGRLLRPLSEKINTDRSIATVKIHSTVWQLVIQAVCVYIPLARSTLSCCVTSLLGTS